MVLAEVRLLRTCTFQQLVEEAFYAAGFSKEAVLSKVFLEAGVSRSSVRAAVNGTRVDADTAAKLVIWAARIHKVELDDRALMAAPPKKRERLREERGDLGKRAEELIEAAVQEVQLPADLSCCVTYECGNGLWHVLCRSGAIQYRGPDLSEALRAVRDVVYGAGRTA